MLVLTIRIIKKLNLPQGHKTFLYLQSEAKANLIQIDSSEENPNRIRSSAELFN